MFLSALRSNPRSKEILSIEVYGDDLIPHEKYNQIIWKFFYKKHLFSNKKIYCWVFNYVGQK